jgi:hypothetical protein
VVRVACDCAAARGQAQSGVAGSPRCRQCWLAAFEDRDCEIGNRDRARQCAMNSVRWKETICAEGGEMSACQESASTTLSASPKLIRTQLHTTFNESTRCLQRRTTSPSLPRSRQAKAQPLARERMHRAAMQPRLGGVVGPHNEIDAESRYKVFLRRGCLCWVVCSTVLRHQNREINHAFKC